MTTAPEDPTAPVRRTLYFSGNVQGVGFRYTTRDIASRFQVTGFVRNLRDGRVEVVAEGTESELDRFQSAVEHAMGGCIAETNVRNAGATGGFASFRIAF